MSSRKKIGVLTSGGDAPGMNGAIRAIVRTAVNNGIDVIGINRGYQGFFDNDFIDLGAKSVCNIINRGGTILKTARCMEMMELEGQKKVASICKDLNIDALFVIGGDGSLTGGLKLNNLGVDIIGIPGTIDLDLACSDYTIGFDTAINTAVEAIDRLRDTSSSHERCSIVEVMGRHAGHIAIWSALAGGAEEVIVPEEEKPSIDKIVDTVRKNRVNGKDHNLIVICEGIGDTQSLAEQIEKKSGIETRATILGHAQRGGIPTALDRVHASCMGKYAVDLYLNDTKNVIVIYKNGKYDSIGLEEGIGMQIDYDASFAKAVRILGV